MSKRYAVEKTSGWDMSRYVKMGSLDELISEFDPILQNGSKWIGAVNNLPVNKNPKSIKGLITALNNAAANHPANDHAQVSFKKI